MTRLWKIPVLGRFVFACWQIDARRKLRWIEPGLGQNVQIVEIGSGPGSLLHVMRTAGYRVDGLDIRDNSFRPTLRPILYNGDIMPFKNKAYDTALLPTILHHTPEPDLILAEAARIARRLIIVEDVYDGAIMGWITKRFDSLMNLEFRGHPHSNRTDAEWCRSFESHGFQLGYRKIYRVGFIFKQAVYILET